MRLRTNLLFLFFFASTLRSTAAPSASDFGGTYVMLQEAVSVTTLPVLRDVVATTRTVALVSLSHHGNRLQGRGKVCDLSIESSSKLIKTTFPPAFSRAIPPLKVDARLAHDSAGIRFQQAARVVVLGARLKNQERDPLPERASDPRVFDHDLDGFPGITVSVSGFVKGDIYLVQRSTSQLLGRRVGQGFSGRLIFANEQKVLGASNPLLKRNPGAVPDLSKSRFRLEQVPGNYDCEKSLKRARLL